MSVVTIDDEIIHYEVLGRGKPLMFLHGWVGSWRYWIPAMQAASIGFRAYALDLWGFGDTAKRPEKYNLERQVNLLDGFLEALGIVKIALVGHGLGALVALSYAEMYPQFVDRLLVNNLPLGDSTLNTRLHNIPVSELTDWLLGRMPGIEAVRTEALKADPQAIWVSLDDIKSLDVMEKTRNLVTPCLMVFGANDPAVAAPLSTELDMLPELVHSVFFDQSGHFPMLDEPSKFNRLLSDFLALESGVSPRQLQLKEEWKRRVR